MTIWVRPDGSEIELNDREETVEKARELGWKKKAGRKPKADNVKKKR